MEKQRKKCMESRAWEIKERDREMAHQNVAIQNHHTRPLNTIFSLFSFSLSLSFFLSFLLYFSFSLSLFLSLSLSFSLSFYIFLSLSFSSLSLPLFFLSLLSFFLSFYYPSCRLVAIDATEFLELKLLRGNNNNSSSSSNQEAPLNRVRFKLLCFSQGSCSIDWGSRNVWPDIITAVSAAAWRHRPF